MGRAARTLALAGLGLALGALGGCASPPAPRAEPALMVPAPDLAARRQVQTRRFADVREDELLAASVGVLQDQGFQVTISAASLGLVSARKTRTTEEALADLAGQFLPGMGRAFLQALTLGAVGDRDLEQQIRVANAYRVAVSTQPTGERTGEHELRAVFYLEYAPTGTREVMLNPVLYQEFFRLLGVALFRVRSGG